MSDAPDMLPGSGPVMGGPSNRDRISGANIDLFNILANEAGRTRTKAAGRDLIARRNNLLQSYDPYQRAKVGNQYYRGGVYDNPDEGYYPQSSATNFIDMISRGDNQFLQGLADDYGSGGNTGGTNTNGGQTGVVGSGGGGFDPGAFQNQIQQMIQTMLGNQQTQFNSTLASLQGAGPTMSTGSVGNMYQTAADRAGARRSGIVNTLASRGRRSASRPQGRYF